MFSSEHQERAQRQGMSSLRKWSKAGSCQDGSGLQLCPRCCLNYLQTNHCAVLGVEILRDLEVNGFFFPSIKCKS